MNLQLLIHITLILLPFFLSFCIGYLLIKIILRKEDNIPRTVLFFLAGGLGLGLSSHIHFFTLILFDRFHPQANIFIHGILFLLLLSILSISFFRKEGRPFFFNRPLFSMRVIPVSLLLALGFLPLWIQAHFYPYGGWDAWAVWNFKAKFIYLAEENWENMFSPILWRSSQHYPLLLPLMNVWGWTFLQDPIYLTPLLTSLTFTLLLIGLLYSGIYYLTRNPFSILAPLLLLSISFFETLATSQYCDILIGYYLLASFVCLVMAFAGQGKFTFLLAGLFLGFLSFTKPEGMLASGLVICLSLGYYFLKKKNHPNSGFSLVFLGLLLTVLPTIIFQLYYAPQNQTFINGLISADKPVSLERFKTLLPYFFKEFTSEKWSHIWTLLAGGILLGYKKCFSDPVVIIPLFLSFYFGVVILYYFVNTYFSLLWWLEVTLNRILFTLLPTVIFWIFCGLWRQDS